MSAGRTKTLKAAGEVLAWWAALTVLYLMLISTVDVAEAAVGAAVAVPAAAGARAARRAARREVCTR